MAKKITELKPPNSPDEVTCGAIPALADQPPQRVSIGEIKEIARIEAQEAVKSLVDQSPVTELVHETPRYFLSATITFFENGYKTIHVSGIRKLNPESLDFIEKIIEDLFADEIEAAGKQMRQDWNGLPSFFSVTFNNINRL